MPGDHLIKDDLLLPCCFCGDKLFGVILWSFSLFIEKLGGSPEFWGAGYNSTNAPDDVIYLPDGYGTYAEAFEALIGVYGGMTPNWEMSKDVGLVFPSVPWEEYSADIGGPWSQDYTPGLTSYYSSIAKVRLIVYGGAYSGVEFNMAYEFVPTGDDPTYEYNISRHSLPLSPISFATGTEGLAFITDEINFAPSGTTPSPTSSGQFYMYFGVVHGHQ